MHYDTYNIIYSYNFFKSIIIIKTNYETGTTSTPTLRISSLSLLFLPSRASQSTRLRRYGTRSRPSVPLTPSYKDLLMDRYYISTISCLLGNESLNYTRIIVAPSLSSPNFFSRLRNCSSNSSKCELLSHRPFGSRRWCSFIYSLIGHNAIPNLRAKINLFPPKSRSFFFR